MSLIQLAQAAAHFEGMKRKFRKAGLCGLEAAAQRGKMVIITQIIPSKTPQPVDRGIFRGGWQVQPTKDGADLYNTETHAAFIEHGVRAENVKIGAQMIVALAEWALRKGLAEDQKEAISIAWGIAKTAQRRGIFNGGKGFKILEECRKSYLPRFIREEVKREIEREFR